MSNYKPFSIANFDKGIHTGKAPWLIPEKAYADLLNVRIRNGVLQKRSGVQLYTEMVHSETATVGTGDGTTKQFTFTLSNTPIRHDTSTTLFKIYDNSGQVVAQSTTEGELTGDVDSGGNNTIDLDTGAVDVTFASAPPDGNSIQAYYHYIPADTDGNPLPVLGIWATWQSGGTKSLLFFNTERVNVWASDLAKTKDVTGAQVFTDASYDHKPWVENWNGIAYITNAKEKIKTFDGTNINDMTIDLGNTGDDVDTSWLVLAHKGHLVLLRPTEGGNTQPQRARWSAVGTDSDWTGGTSGFVDAPTPSWIVSATFLRNELVVIFEKEIWKLRYTGDPNLPFQWEKLIATVGASARFGSLPFSNEVMFLTATDISVTDGVTAQRANEPVPEITLGFNQSRYGRVYGLVLEEEDEAWWSHPTIDSDVLNHILVHNYMNGSWTVYDLDFECFGYQEEQAAFTWDETFSTWNELTRIWDDREAQAGYPITLGGDTQGKIWQVNRTSTDKYGAAISARIWSREINPFWQQGYQARLGYLDIYYDANPYTEVTIDVYDREHEAVLFSTTVTLSGPVEGARTWTRLPINCVANTHMLRVYHEAADQDFTIHGLVSWMKPAGRLA